jgi:tRNA threonylcarbamoyl adenosine modification protein YeaZ
VLTLAFDTSTPAVTVGLVRSGEVPVERTVVATNRHGELLATLVAEVLRSAGVAPIDLARIGVGLGPGPFTGLRVGIVTAKAMADALGIPVFGVGSLDVLAFRLAHDNGEYAVISDARRKQVYWARYDEAGRRLEGPEIGTPAGVAQHLAAVGVALVAGAGAAAYPTAFDGFELLDRPHPSGGDLATLVAALDEPIGRTDSLTPLYLRRPDAVPPGRPKQVTPA